MSARRTRGQGHCLLAAALAACALAGVAGPGAMAAAPATHAPHAKTPRLADGHPDLNGNWEGSTGSSSTVAFPHGSAPEGSINAGIMSDPAMAKRILEGMQETGKGHANAAFPIGVRPQWKSDALRDKAEALWQNGSETDGVVLCAQPGLPRVGAPNKIIQTHSELVFLYADPSGMAWRVVPTDGRGFREHFDATAYGDSVGHWEGDTLVVETRNLSEDTWFGEYGYFHGPRMRVTERYTRTGDTLAWQATVEDPDNLAAPWVKPVVTLHHTARQIEPADPCVAEPVETGHHEQRAP